MTAKPESECCHSNPRLLTLGAPETSTRIPMRAPNPMVSAPQTKILAALLTFSSLVEAQVVVAPTGATLPSIASSAAFGANVKAPSAAEIASAFLKSGPLAKWGPIGVRPHLSYRLLYSNGLLNPEQLESAESTIHEIAAGSLFEIGRQWTFDYTGSKSFYSNPIFKSALGHQFTLNGILNHDDWTFGLSQTFSTSTPILVETGRQTPQETYSVTGNTSYRLGERTLLNVSATRSFRKTNADIVDPQWTEADWLLWIVSGGADYQATQRLSVGVGAIATFDRVSEGSDMDSIRPNLSVTWRPTTRLSFTSQGGIETRRINNGTVGNLTNTVYSASLQYHPFIATSVSLYASQNVNASYFANQASKSSNIGLNVSQRLFRKFYFSGGLSRGITNYIATTSFLTAGRNDRYRSYNASLTTIFLQRGSIGLFFSTGRNATNTRDFAFSSHQYGTEFSYRF